MAEIPTLTTERLNLRPMQSADWRVFEAYMRSARSRHLGGPYDLKVSWGMFCSNHAQWHLFGCGALMIDDRDDGNCLGQVGIDSGPLCPEQALGFFLLAEAEGHGYAEEATSALRDWARMTRKLPTLVSYVAHQNTQARKLLKTLGAEIDEYAPRPDPSDLVFRHFCMGPVRAELAEIAKQSARRKLLRKSR